MRPRSMRDVTSNSETGLNDGQPPAARRVRGLRDVMSSRKIAGRSAPATRSQQLSEIAWLDREMERLNREMGILDANRTRVAARLQEVVDRREAILGAIRDDLGLLVQPPAPQPKHASDEDEVDTRSESFSLEY